MKIYKRLFIIIAIIIIIAIVFAVKNKDIKSDLISFEFNKEKEKTTIYDEVNIPMEKVRTLNPIISKDYYTYQISNLLYEKLFYFDDNHILQKGLVSEYRHDEKKGELIIKIRNDSYFSDGENLDASDVKESINSYIYQSYKNNTIYSKNISNIRYITLDRDDNYKLIIKLKNKADFTIDNLVLPILKKEEIEAEKYYYKTNDNTIFTGSGPYKVEKYDNISKLKLIGNNHYNGKNKANNTMNFIILPKENIAVALLEVDLINMALIKDLDRDIYLSNNNIKSFDFVSNEMDIIGFNCSKGITSDVNFRNALSKSINKVKINNNIYFKKLDICEDLIVNNYIGINQKKINYKDNEKQSDKLFEKIKKTYEYTYLKNNINILVNNQNIYAKQVSEYIKAVLEKKGFKVKINLSNDETTFSNNIKISNYDIFVGTINMSENYDLSELIQSNYNLSKYRNKKIDKKLELLRKDISIEKRRDTILEINKILEKEKPYCVLGYRKYGCLYNEFFLNEDMVYRFNNIYNGCEKWKTQYKNK